MSHTEPSPSSSALWVCPWVGHRDVSALRNTPSLVSLLVCVFPQECLQQTLPIWGCSGAVKPRDESLCILTHLTTRCKLRISSSPFSGGSFGWIWVELQGFACCFAWQMNGWGCPCRARWIHPFPRGDKQPPLLLQHWCHLRQLHLPEIPWNIRFNLL